jgi:hypothetical protein
MEFAKKVNAPGAGPGAAPVLARRWPRRSTLVQLGRSVFAVACRAMIG